MDPRGFEKDEREALAKARGRVSKATDKVEFYDVVEDLNTTDEQRMPTRRVLGDISVLQPKVEFMPPKTMTWATAGDVAVPVDEWIRGDLQESQPPTQRYICENPGHARVADSENFLSPGESEGVRPANFVAPSPSSVLKAVAQAVADGYLVPDDTAKSNVAKRWSKNGVSFADVIQRGGDPVGNAERFMGGK